MNMPELPDWTSDKGELEDLVEILDRIVKLYDSELNAMDLLILWATIPEETYTTS
jgi:hypothetical protein